MSQFHITKVRTEYQINPLGLDEKQPRISWKLKAQEQNFKQAAYQVCVGSPLLLGEVVMKSAI